MLCFNCDKEIINNHIFCPACSTHPGSREGEIEFAKQQGAAQELRQIVRHFRGYQQITEIQLINYIDSRCD